jgi:hypothetical protein
VANRLEIRQHSSLVLNTGDSHGQSKEARCGAQEELETRQGKRQACAQDGCGTS